MAYPRYVHSVVGDLDPWPVQAQGENECGVTSPANALNLLVGERRFDKDSFIRAAGWLFQRPLGGSPSFMTSWMIKRSGFGTHFGTLAHTDADAVLRDLVDRKVPVIIELWANHIGPFTLYGLHSVVLVGYSDPYIDAAGQPREEYYVVDAQYPALGHFDLRANNADRDGDGIAEKYPGNRTFSREELRANYPTGIYFPVFRSQAEHAAWYVANIEPLPRLPLLGALGEALATGRHDRWHSHA